MSPLTTQVAGNEPIVQTGIETGPVDYAPMQWPGGCGAEAVFIGRTRNQEHPEHGPFFRERTEAEWKYEMAFLKRAAAGQGPRPKRTPWYFETYYGFDVIVQESDY